MAASNVGMLSRSTQDKGREIVTQESLKQSGPPSSAPALLSSSTSNTHVGLLSGFEGLNETQSCACVPPDVQVASGPNHVVEMVNLEGEIFSKQGVTVKTFALSSLFSTGSDSISDPKVLFDNLSGRWFTSIVDISLGSVIVGVSSTNDPTGTFVSYSLNAGGNLPDQPIIGVSNDKFVAAANDIFSRSFVGSQYWVLNKSEMLNGAAVSFVTSGANGGFFSIHPVQSLSPTTTQFMVSQIVSRKSLLTNSVELFSVTGVPGVSTVSVGTNVLSVSTLNSPPGGVQPGTASTINTGDFRIQSAVWFAGKLWYVLNEGCTPSGDTQVRSCIRLTMIDTATSPAVVKQDFDSAASGQYLFYPAVAMDANGDLDLIYGYSSSTIFPSVAVTGQLITDPADSLATPRTLKAGSAADTSTRYGDYFGAGLDPSSPTTIWAAGEYHSNTTGSCGSFGSCWSTFIGSFAMTTPVPVNVNSLVGFSGIDVNTTGLLTINTLNLTVSGNLRVVAKNGTSGGVLLNRTYAVPVIHLVNQTGTLEGSFLLNIGISPFPLSSNIRVKEVSGNATSLVQVTRRVDVDGNGMVGIDDLAIVASVYHAVLGSSTYNGSADIDGNGVIDIGDLSLVALYYHDIDVL